MHCGLRCEPWLADIPALSEQIDDWPVWLHGEEEDAAVAALRRHTSTGRPLGSATFLNLLVSILGRTVRPRKAGRPRKPSKREIWVAFPISLGHGGNIYTFSDGVITITDWFFSRGNHVAYSYLDGL